MPRVTKADLTASLEASQSRVESLQEDLRVERFTSGSMCNALDRMHARVAVLEKENKALKAERGQGDRSRSPRRDATSAANTHRVLKLVQHFERDNVVDEQRETIARQQREIASLRRGDGPIREVLLHNWTQSPGTPSEFTVETLKAQTSPVNTTLKSLQRLASAQADLSLWCGLSDYQVTTLSPVELFPISRPMP
jgi:hypothetical protein